MIVLGVITPGVNYVRLTAASGTSASNIDNKDIFVDSLFVQADAANNTVATLQYNGDELATIGTAASATADMPILPIVGAGTAPNVYNLKLFSIKGGDADDKFRAWATQQ